MTNTTANRPLAVSESNRPHLAHVCEWCWSKYCYVHFATEDKSTVTVRSELLGGEWRLVDDHESISGGSTGESFADRAGSPQWDADGRYLGYVNAESCLVCGTKGLTSKLLGEVWAVPVPRVTVVDTHRTTITTKYLGPTNSRGSRVKAVTRNGYGDRRGISATVSWDHALNSAENHAEAVRVLADRLGWTGTWALGHTEEGVVAVLIESVQG